MSPFLLLTANHSNSWSHYRRDPGQTSSCPSTSSFNLKYRSQTLSAEHAHIVVRRDKLLENALLEVRKTRFDPTKLLNVSDVQCVHGLGRLAIIYWLSLLFRSSMQVQFVGEEAVDTGGPTREFWRLFIQEVVRHYCVGDSEMCLFVKNLPALEVSGM